YLAKRPHEILTEIHVPDVTGWRATYRKPRPRGSDEFPPPRAAAPPRPRRRGSIDFPIRGVAAALRLGKDQVVEDARIVLGAVHTHPVEATDAQQFLKGRPLDAETIEMAAGGAYTPARPPDNRDTF